MDPRKLPNSVKQGRAIRPFKVIQGHQFWYQLKAYMRLPISDLIVTYIIILGHSRDIVLKVPTSLILTTPLAFNPHPHHRWRVSAGTISIKFWLSSTVVCEPNAVETLPKISIVWLWRTNVTDRRQTDMRQHIPERNWETAMQCTIKCLSLKRRKIPWVNLPECASWLL